MDELIRQLLIYKLQYPWNTRRPILDYPGFKTITIRSNYITIHMEDSGPPDPCITDCDNPFINYPEVQFDLSYVCGCGDDPDLLDDPAFLYVTLWYKLNGIWISSSSTYITNYWFFLRRLEGWNINLCCDDVLASEIQLQKFCGNSPGTVFSTVSSPNIIKNTIQSFMKSNEDFSFVSGDLNDFELFNNFSNNTGDCWDGPGPCDDGTLSVKLFINNILITEQVYDSVMTSALFTFVTSNQVITDLGLDPGDIFDFTLVKELNSGDTLGIVLNPSFFSECGYNYSIKAVNCPGSCSSSGSGWFLTPGIDIPGITTNTRLSPPGSRITPYMLAVLVAALSGGTLLVSPDGTPILNLGGVQIVLSFIECPGPFDLVNEFYP